MRSNGDRLKRTARLQTRVCNLASYGEIDVNLESVRSSVACIEKLAASLDGASVRRADQTPIKADNAGDRSVPRPKRAPTIVADARGLHSSKISEISDGGWKFGDDVGGNAERLSQ